MKKIILGILIGLALIVLPKDVAAKEKVTIYLFRGNTCNHCEAALKYINSHKEEIPEGVDFITYEVYADSKASKNNAKLLNKIGKKLGLPEDDLGSVPLFVVGDSYVMGYANATDFNKVLNLVNKYENNEEDYQDIVAKEIKDSKLDVKSMTLAQIFSEPNKVVTTIVFCVFGVIILGFGAMILFSRKG